MSELTQADLQFVVRRLPKDVRDIMMAQGLYVGGGFIRETIAGGEVKDVDLFGPTKEKLTASADFLVTKREGAKSHKTNNAITVLSPPRMPVQFILRWLFDDAEKLVSSFDFTVCQAVIWFAQGTQTWRSLCHDRFYSDLAARRLFYTAPVREEEAGGSMMRVRKFLARGYNIQAVSLGAVIARVAMKVRWDDTITEDRVSRVISGLLIEVDPSLVVDGFEPIDEHEGVQS